MSAEINSTTKSIRERLGTFVPETGIILGSGLGALANEIEDQLIIPYSQIPHFPHSTVKGHSGQLIFGKMGGRNVVAMQGRFHFYEGYTMQQITFPVRVMKALGIQHLFVSNAAGGMNPKFRVGELMIINDHINLFPTNPLIGQNDDTLGPRFVDMGEAYSKRLIALAEAAATKNSIEVSQGVYAGLTGPCFETPAEYRYLWRIGADAVGMSTVPEVIVAKHSGLEVFGMSIITDLGVEGHVEKVSHEDVLRVANAQEKKLTVIMKDVISKC